MKVTVLYGGPSAEREVSLVSGRAVIDALRSVGHDVFPSDVSPTDLSGLDHPADAIFPVLHGAFGESGELQEILEQRGLPFVGSGSKASRIGIDKVRTKQIWEKAGLPTPPYRVIRRGDVIPSAPGSCVVKAIDSGSSIDVYLCKAPAESSAQASKAIRQVLSRHESALVEKFIDGIELTVGLLEEKPLAPIRIVPKREFFDYEAKYRATDTEHRFDTGLPIEVVENCRELARRASAAIGARDLARIDIMLDSTNHPFLLEINTLPGFTPRSLLPEAAKHAGIDFGPLVDRLVRRAAARGGRIENSNSKK
jgi:D-alanine-D-alanine ligase